ncbi:dephospho-CoA kinase [Neisseria leonii]|uniref:dephospho-CoA kinase n=1 Tax=Neisseria leonii TaxID=2995413 RepID=UPI00237A27EF|nr:dephospho-CoA kinase [Neisseria sp. 3986]MDD9324806.1 dephospho-CoA kinase [Neisseria sp. 3986]
MTAWVGLTGGIGSGKSSAAAQFARLGVPVVDADAVSRSLTAAGGAALPLIRERFGSGVFSDGLLDRAKLRGLVFGDADKKAALEALMFPLILAEMRAQMAAHAGAVYGVAEIPLLAENPAFRQLVERVAVVDVPPEVQIVRVRQRNGLSEAEVKRIMAAQSGRAARLAVADDVIDNSGTEAELAGQVLRLHRLYSQLYATAGPGG